MNSRNILFLILGLFLSACGSKKESNSVPVSYSGEKPVVEVVHPLERTFEVDIAITGNLEANQMVELHAMEGGFVKAMHKDIGDHVGTGEVIAELMNPELVMELKRAEAQLQQAKQGAAKAKASLMKAEADRNFRKKKYDRLSRIYGKTPDLVTVDDMDQAEAGYLMAKGAFGEAVAEDEHAASAIESAEALVGALQTRVDMLQVKAPFNGYITNRYVDKGALITNSLTNSNAIPIVDMVDVGKLRLVIEYPEADIAYINKGTKVEIEFPELGGKKYLGEISRMAAALNPQSKTIRAEVDITDNDGKLKPGMYAKVRTRQQTRKDVLAIPTQAITSEKNQNFIFLVRDNVVKKIPIRLGLEDKFYIEAISDELGADDFVVVQGKGLISEGMEVVAKEK